MASTDDIDEHDSVRVESTGDYGTVVQLPGDYPGIRIPRLPAGTFRILCVDGTLKTVEARDVTLADRHYFRPGSLVLSPSGTGGGDRIGVVTGSSIALDLVKLGHGEPPVKVTGVSPGALRRDRELSLGDFVVSGPWLGRVVDECLDFVVVFDDGAACKVSPGAQRKLWRVVAKTNGRSQRLKNHRLFPGQRVTGPFRDCRWLSGHWKPSHEVGTVAKVEMAGVLVYWITHANDQRLVQAAAPPAYQDPSNLTFLFSDRFCCWLVGDRCFVRDTEQEAGKKRLSRKHRRGRRRHAAQWEVEQPMRVASTRTTLDVLWQDGTRQSAVPSTSLLPIYITSEHDFLPGHIVVQSTAPDTGEVATGQTTRRVGIVRSMDSEDQTVDVSWFKEASGPEEAIQIECDGTVSAYDLAMLHHHPFYGKAVVRRAPAQGGEVRATVDAAATTDLSWVGRVVDLTDGRVQVKWGDGTTSTVSYRDISVVMEYHYEELLDAMGGDGDWLEEDTVDARQDEDSSANNTDNEPKNPADDSNVEGDHESVDEVVENSVDEYGTATTRASRLGGIIQSLLAQAMSYLPGGLSSSLSSNLAAVINGHESTSNHDVIHVTEAAMTNNDDDDSANNGEKNLDTTGDEGQVRFPQFDLTQSPSDHHYIDNMGEGGSGGKRWVKAVQKEWKIMENNLPDTIYVRAFEDRMDLLRVVMVGASGTPYQDGLFFFDMHMPPSYPAVPPLVYYHSFGLRLNPNLYDSGTVCLSLLNTFGGDASEVWSPATSSLLQVVVSIQGLILNEQPFFNEAGYETLVGRPEGRRNAVPYSENAYLLTLRTMLHLLRRPPSGFEGFVRDHFRRRGRFVLKACEAYLRGSVVGSLDGDAGAAKGSKEDRSCPAGLRLALASVLPRLVAALADIGAEGCERDQFHELTKLVVGDGGPSAH